MSAAIAIPHFAELQAPPGWNTVDFISDLHLQAGEPETFDAWRRYMAATPAHAVFILGDLFEVWVGDDMALAPGFVADCASVLQATARHAAIFFMHGNRDFLIGDGFMRACGATLLSDPTVLGFAQQRFVLTHGDALCLGDTSYMKFREQVRAPEWQREFLAKPFAHREAIARDLRAQSEARKRAGLGVEYADVDADAADAWLEAADATTMIHGHTHRPARHAMTAGRERVVLSDWDAHARPARQEILRLTPAGVQRLAFTS
jgi:UDP-2,3-diacylglucosamine hydrolase